MLGAEQIKQIVDPILARSTAGQTEVAVIATDLALTRFANSEIHQNVAESNVVVRIRTVLRDGAEGARVGVATTNNLSHEALQDALDRAKTVARLQPPNPVFRSLPGPEPYPDLPAFSQATAGCTPEERARLAGTICLLARDAGVAASGALATATVEVAVANSLGVKAYFPVTYADATTVIMSDTSAGYAAALVLDVRDLDVEAIGREAVDKCLRSRNPRPLEAGEYAVVLEPYAVQDFVQMMTYTGFGAVAYQEGRSFLSGRLGQPIVDPRISIWDDGLDPVTIPLPFDFEGVPRLPVDLIRDGVARGVVYDTYRAGREQGKRSTGHALPASAGLGPLPIHVHFAPGDASIDEMVRSTERGIYVTRFNYTRPVDPARLVITGLTRDGTFLIEKGEIVAPVKNLRFTQGYLEALNGVEMIGSRPRLLMGIADAAHDYVPALKLSRFTFTGTTQF